MWHDALVGFKVSSGKRLNATWCPCRDELVAPVLDDRGGTNEIIMDLLLPSDDDCVVFDVSEAVDKVNKTLV
jgi:hypothetical protein